MLMGPIEEEEEGEEERCLSMFRYTLSFRI
jgi:hypothetical protein